MERSAGSNSAEGGDIDGEDQEESSSQDHVSTLNEFRKEWKREIESSPHHSSKCNVNTTEQEQIPHNIEDKAKVFFQLGIENEEKGKHYEAIQFYRRAVQLVPDIEFKIFQMTTHSSKESNNDTSDEEEINSIFINTDQNDELCFNASKMDLLTHLSIVNLKHHRTLCIPAQPQKGTHFSSLPMEIFLYILRWVVSTDLDVRSLEICSRVCRGFYICCRDQEIWRTACSRVWGVKCGSPSGQYRTWREMFIKRPRLHFGGCYISKTTYIRHGENSFQDQYYRPWHLVVYYRYLRFFSDGRVLMLTTPEEPVGCVSLLRTKLPGFRQPPVFTGYYRLVDTTVFIVLSPGPDKKATKSNTNQTHSHTFHIELEIVSYRNRLHGQLIWRGYSVFTKRNGIETNTPFDIDTTKYPPFWYSRVKSYLAESTTPLCN
ncbi:F-box only protein 9 isoform X2 [Cimex lectularius]|uniref:F-box only protein 9 n=1 Tax=Cimex lectularius TaxID=79782 RepID=A0A8I6SAJ2_CIMLE|nr:F-box only protein 9 isoform X2 [Cimex lectularius]